MLIQKNLCPKDRYWQKATYSMTPVGICIHNTGNSTDAIHEMDYAHRSDDYRSFHYAVDEMNAVQGIPLDRNAWHAGDGDGGIGNREYIAIEICRSYVIPPKNATPAQEAECEARWRKEFKSLFEKAQENAAELTATLLHDMGWGKDLSRVKKHQDFDGKYCPHRTLSDYGWEYFLDLVRKKYEELYEEEPMTAAEKEAFKKLEDKVVKLEAKVKAHNDQIGIKWAYVDKNLPEWARPTAEKLVKKKILQGTKNSYEMSYLLLRILVMLDRAGMFD